MLRRAIAHKNKWGSKNLEQGCSHAYELPEAAIPNFSHHKIKHFCKHLV